MTTPPDWEERQLFNPGPQKLLEIRTKIQKKPVWSESKAQLITKYLQFFVYITHHGTYIDAFAGPQTDQSDQAWTAQLVLSNEPKWFRKFYLFDKSPKQIEQLHQLADEHRDRDVQVFEGDCNHTLPSVLPAGSIGEREATFCLLDQRTFECKWQLCQHISQLRTGSMKVEQFYFLANDWLPRAFAGISTLEGEERVAAWVGQPDWRPVAQLRPFERAELFVHKFKDELGYRWVVPWPIYERSTGIGKIMYWMIHASDHPEAPKQMARAYSQSVAPPNAVDQLALGVNGQ